jgi:hypothetical protein
MNRCIFGRLAGSGNLHLCLLMNLVFFRKMGFIIRVSFGIFIILVICVMCAIFAIFAIFVELVIFVIWAIVIFFVIFVWFISFTCSPNFIILTQFLGDGINVI